MLRLFGRLLHEAATCGKSSVVRRPNPAFSATLPAFDFDCGSNTCGVTHVSDGSIELRDIGSSFASGSAGTHVGSPSGTTFALPSALRGRSFHWWHDRQPQLSANISSSTGLRGQCRSVATTSGGPEGSDSSDTEQQRPEPGSEGIEAASEAEAVQQSEQDILKELELLMSDPSGQPLHPELRGARAWEPFVELDPDEGLEDYGGTIESIDQYDEMLDQWGNMMEEGDFAGVLSMLEHRLPKVSGIPPLDEILQRDSREERREERRKIEEALQQEYAARRVRSVDHLGRAYATGRRKTSVARVWIWPGPGSFSINRRPLDMHFPQLERRNDVLAPFEVTGLLGGFNMIATVKGGGVTGQAQALRHGISCALQKWDPELRPPLKAAGFLTRDSRKVERKKPGRAKARKAFQWVKR